MGYSQPNFTSHEGSEQTTAPLVAFLGLITYIAFIATVATTK